MWWGDGVLRNGLTQSRNFPKTKMAFLCGSVCYRLGPHEGPGSGPVWSDNPCYNAEKGVRIARKGGKPMAPGKLLSTREVARITDLPESTVRWYQRQFDGFLPVLRDGRGVWWPPEALPILRTIRESFGAGLAREDVGHVLASVRPEPTPAETRPRKIVVQSVVDRARALEALQEDVAQIRNDMHALPKCYGMPAPL